VSAQLSSIADPPTRRKKYAKDMVEIDLALPVRHFKDRIGQDNIFRTLVGQGMNIVTHALARCTM